MTYMKHIILLSSFFFVFLNLSKAQETNVQWFENMEEAKIYATEHQANILMVFSGSDWCKPCIQFKKDILEAEDFKTWGASKLVILYLDFPARKKNKLSPDQTAHNENLAEQYNKSGTFPNVFLMDEEANVLANPAFKGQDVTDFIAKLELKTK